MNNTLRLYENRNVQIINSDKYINLKIELGELEISSGGFRGVCGGLRVFVGLE